MPKNVSEIASQLRSLADELEGASVDDTQEESDEGDVSGMSSNDSPSISSSPNASGGNGAKHKLALMNLKKGMGR